MKKRFVNPVLISVYIFFTGIFLSCGIEEYYYLDPVPQTNITVVMNNTATINLPTLTQSYATHYTIFYRIYISGLPTSSEIQNSSVALREINPSLFYDYDTIYPYTDPAANTTASAIDSLFRSRAYYELELEGIDIKSKLSSGGTVTIDFPANSGYRPTLTRNNETPVHLYRSNGGGDFTPEPDRLFFNSDDINNNSKATSTINADVAPNTGITGSQRYTYVSMYIVTVGLNLEGLNQIYSKPTHISIFKLPNREN